MQDMNSRNTVLTRAVVATRNGKGGGGNSNGHAVVTFNEPCAYGGDRDAKELEYSLRDNGECSRSDSQCRRQQ